MVTRFAYDGADMVVEYNASNTMLRRYVHGRGSDEPIVWYEGSGTTDRRFLMADERGSVVSVSNASGTVLAINRYDEYGIPASTNLGRFQYTGQTWVPEIGMYYYKARMYSPTLGRFMQTDPIGYADGMNWYAYVGGDPVNSRDPSGLEDDNGDIVVNGERKSKAEVNSTAWQPNFTGFIYGAFSIFNLGVDDDTLVVMAPQVQGPPDVMGYCVSSVRAWTQAGDRMADLGQVGAIVGTVSITLLSEGAGTVPAFELGGAIYGWSSALGDFTLLVDAVNRRQYGVPVDLGSFSRAAVGRASGIKALRSLGSIGPVGSFISDAVTDLGLNSIFDSLIMDDPCHF